MTHFLCWTEFEMPIFQQQKFGQKQFIKIPITSRRTSCNPMKRKKNVESLFCAISCERRGKKKSNRTDWISTGPII